ATNAYHLAVGDLNGDSKPDVVASSDYQQISVLLNAGNGTFLPYQGMVTSGSIANLVIGDATGDGHADVIVGGGTSVSIFPGNGSGAFGARIDIPVSGSSSGRIATGDFNGDSHLDIVTSPGNSYYDTSHAETVLLGDGLGGFPIQHTVESVYGLVDQT